MSIINSNLKKENRPIKNYYWDIEGEKFHRAITIAPAVPIIKTIKQKAATKMTVY